MPHALDVGGESDAPQLAAAFRGRPPSAEAVVVDGLQRGVQSLVVVTDVVHERDRGLVGELILADEVAPSQLCWIDPHLVGRDVHDALDEVPLPRAVPPPDRHPRGRCW